MYILGIETSCDETAAAVIKSDIKNQNILVLSNIIASQIAIHKQYGGVIPEVAAREHVTHILPTIDKALKEAKIKKEEIDYLAITKGPGLITSLLTGVETVRSLAYVLNKPVIEINHIEGHIYANFIEHAKNIKFPAIILTVSGGHTNLVLMQKNQQFKIIGETLDDAAGEAYDKGAKMMNLDYPGGPIISKNAQIYQNKIKNKLKDDKIKLPQPMINDKTFNFSFSGLKTALLYKLQEDKNWSRRIPKYCYYYQKAINSVLIKKTIKAAKKYKVKSVMLSGGVSANYELRKNLKKAIKKELLNTLFFVPNIKYTTDNAAMIAAAASFKAKKVNKKNFSQLTADPNFKLN